MCDWERLQGWEKARERVSKLDVVARGCESCIALPSMYVGTSDRHFYRHDALLPGLCQGSTQTSFLSLSLALSGRAIRVEISMQGVQGGRVVTSNVPRGRQPGTPCGWHHFNGGTSSTPQQHYCVYHVNYVRSLPSVTSDQKHVTDFSNYYY